MAVLIAITRQDLLQISYLFDSVHLIKRYLFLPWKQSANFKVNLSLRSLAKIENDFFLLIPSIKDHKQSFDGWPAMMD